MNNIQQHEAYECHQRIVELRNLVEVSFLHLGKELYGMQENKWYLDMDYPTFFSYLHAPETNIDPSIAYLLIRVYKKFDLELEVEPVTLLKVGYSKLDILIPAVTKDNVGEWLTKAEVLSRGDLRIERKGKDINPLEGFYVAYRHFYSQLQNLLDTHPSLRSDILATATQLEDLKDKL